jgi:hypothetical protein
VKVTRFAPPRFVIATFSSRPVSLQFCAHTFHHRDGNNASVNIYTAVSSLHTRSTFTYGKNEVEEEHQVLDDGRGAAHVARIGTQHCAERLLRAPVRAE